MKKKILSGVFALALLVATGYGVNKSMNNNVGFSDLALMNVEALAQESGEDIIITCGQYEGRCWDGFPTPSGLHFDCYFTGLQRHYCVWDPFGIG